MDDNLVKQNNRLMKCLTRRNLRDNISNIHTSLRGNWTPDYFLTNIRIEQIHGRSTQGQVGAWPLTKATLGRG